jgi:predicted ester cyclase
MVYGGWAGAYSLADTIFSSTFSTNGTTVGPEGPKRNIRNRLNGFPDLTTDIEEIIAVDDRVVIRLNWRGTHSGMYSGLPPTAKQVSVRVIAIWRFEGDVVEENWTVQDQFALLKQIGYIPPEVEGAQVPNPKSLL